MPDPNERDAKLVQFLSEAHTKEKELETALELHIAMTSRPPYKKRLKQHLKETKSHAKQLERRIKKLGGGGSIVKTATTVAGKGKAAAKGQIDIVRGLSPVAGTGEAEQMLKNARQEYTEEAQEIATYRSIEAFAEKVADRETAKLARDIRREEERMAKFLERQIKTLAGAVAQEEVPADQRRKTSGRRRTTAAKRSPSTKASAKSTAARKRTPAKRTTAKRTGAKRATAKRS